MSMRRYLVLTLLSIIILATFTAAIQGYQTSMREAAQFFDEDLKVDASNLANMNFSPENKVVRSLPQIAYQFWQNNQLLVKTANTPDHAIAPQHVGFSDRNFSHQRWRIYVAKIVPISTSNALLNTSKKITLPRWIMVAQPIETRFALAEQLILAAVTPIILVIPFIALIIWLIVWHGLQPLNRLALQLTHKKANDLSPIALPDIPKELQIVEQTINNLFTRLDEAFTREKRFASDAAHELRTPLSVLKVNVHNLQQEIGTQNDTLNHLSSSVDRMAHVIDQILLLNRTNPKQFSQQFTLVDLNLITQQVIADLYPEISHRQQTIELHGSEALLQGSNFALRTLVQNLISNASKYTPKKGQIQVRLQRKAQQITWQIEDSGNGIATSEYDKVFNRFYRIGGDRHQSAILGCGLGLAIVKHIAQLHHATIKLSSSLVLKGLQVQVTFPISLAAITGNNNE